MGWERHHFLPVMLLTATRHPAAQFGRNAALLFLTASFRLPLLQRIKEEYASPDSPVAVFGGWRRPRRRTQSAAHRSLLCPQRSSLYPC